jgi:DNA-binding HxlR family transcriptional regulator
MKDQETETRPALDRIIHERARLKILVFLASSQDPETGFTDIKQALDMSSGNLSVQLGTLEEAGYVEIRKAFKGRKPYTGISLTPAGKSALGLYLDELESMLSLLRKGKQ